MTPAAKLRPSPNVPGSMEAAVKMWLKVGNIQKLQQVREEIHLISDENKINAEGTLKGFSLCFQGQRQHAMDQWLCFVAR